MSIGDLKVVYSQKCIIKLSRPFSAVDVHYFCQYVLDFYFGNLNLCTCLPVRWSHNLVLHPILRKKGLKFMIIETGNPITYNFPWYTKSCENVPR